MPQVSSTIDKFLTSQTLNYGERSTILLALGALSNTETSSSGGSDKIIRTSSTGRIDLISGEENTIQADVINSRVFVSRDGTSLPVMETSATSVDMYNTSTEAKIFSSSQSSLYDTTGTASLNWDVRTVYDLSGVGAINWDGRNLFSFAGETSVDWGNRIALDVSGNTSFDWGNRALINTVLSETLNWETLIARDGNNIDSINWGTRTLVNSFNVPVITWEGATLWDGSGFISVDWNTRFLADASGETALDWSAGSVLRAPLQESMPTDPTCLMVLQSSDNYYGRRYVLGGLNQGSSITSASYSTVASVSLAPGSYTYRGVLIGHTASSTAGVLVEVSGTALEVFGVAMKGTAATEGASGVSPTMYCKSTGVNFADVATATVAGGASGKYAFTEISGVIRLTSTATFSLKVKQLTTDAVNPTYCSKGSHVEFRKI